MIEEYLFVKYPHLQIKSLEDYERLKKSATRSKSQSRFVRNQLLVNARSYSNGENMFAYLTEKISENGLYILDESENSLSPMRQVELKTYIETSARYVGCQFIISTHLSFLLSMRETKIYDMDESPAEVKRWTKLENVRTYYEFLKKHEDQIL